MMKIDHTRYKVWKWSKALRWFYLINPFSAINELILGQRLPKTILIDYASDKPLMERAVVPCPHCETLHDQRLWAKGRAFKNWFGLFCPTCQRIIPCLRCWMSYFILALTYPLWFWWIDRWKKQWLARQPRRYEHVNLEATTHQKISAIKLSLIWGAGMFVFMTAYHMLINNHYTWGMALTHLPIWIVGGLAFGYVTKWWAGRRPKRSPEKKQPNP